MHEAATHSSRDRSGNARADRHAAGAKPGRNAAKGHRTASTYRTTLYRIDGVAPDPKGLLRALNNRYLREQDFEITPTTVAGAPALVVHGYVPREKADWCGIITRLTGGSVAVGYSSAGGALLVAVDDKVYALTYGTVGRHMINLELADPGFGIAFAIRAIEPEQIRRVTRRVLASTGRVDRSLVPGGQHIRHYGIEQWGEIVGQLCGTLLENERLTVTRFASRPVSIAGANSLQIPLNVDPTGLLADLREISRVCARDTPSPELEFVAQVQPLQTGVRTENLDQQLDDLLGESDPQALGLAVPTAQVEYEPFAASYQVKVPYRRTYRTELDLETILERAQSRPVGKRLDALKTGAIALCADAYGEELLCPPTPANRWLTAEIAVGSAHMIYHEGRWYEIGDRHLDFLRAEIEALLNRPPTVALPPWTSGLADEDAYNKHAAASGPGYVLLDKRLLKTRQHKRGHGIEACDLLGPGNELIHIKRAERSSPLSHLFLQGEVAVDALRYEAEARERLVQLVHAHDPSHPIDVSFKPTKVVYGIALGSGRRLTADTLFTFSQVALYRAVRRLRSDDIDVEVIGIPGH
ncbi:DUF6119 family protein [Dactylosporangium sp. NPDC049140]|uniref:DUF6119 family protein n=1 Tax=Dactylosporangium sp. NPDC049140 TaxID=3155647 RepID=UPI0033C37FEA